jgi:hypothetical protein
VANSERCAPVGLWKLPELWTKSASSTSSLENALPRVSHSYHKANFFIDEGIRMPRSK